jgi:hypothetical protein
MTASPEPGTDAPVPLAAPHIDVLDASCSTRCKTVCDIRCQRNQREQRGEKKLAHDHPHSVDAFRCAAGRCASELRRGCRNDRIEEARSRSRAHRASAACRAISLRFFGGILSFRARALARPPCREGESGRSCESQKAADRSAGAPAQPLEHSRISGRQGLDFHLEAGGIQRINQVLQSFPSRLPTARRIWVETLCRVAVLIAGAIITLAHGPTERANPSHENGHNPEVERGHLLRHRAKPFGQMRSAGDFTARIPATNPVASPPFSRGGPSGDRSVGAGSDQGAAA